MTVEVLKPDFRRAAGPTPLHQPEVSVKMEIADRSYVLSDLSMDGTALVVFDGEAEPGQVLQATMTFPFQGCHFAVPVDCEVTSFHRDKSQLGIRIRQDEDPGQRELLSSVFRAVAFGEGISASEILKAAQQRAEIAHQVGRVEAKRSAGESIRRRLGAIAFVLLAGVLVAFITANLATRAYVIQADGAIVNPQSRIERMPLAAELVSYAAPIGARVPPKSTVAILRTKTGEMIPINSDCDCVMGGQLATSPLFLNKGEPIAQLVPVDGTNHAVLTVPLGEMRRIRVGDKVTANFYDSSLEATGTVERVSAPKLLQGVGRGDAAATSGKIEVRFADKLPAWRVGEPINARITLSRFNPLA